MYNEYLFKTKDGALLNVYKAGSGDKKIIITNGLGGNFKIFREIIKFFPNYEFISWDYRGLYHSKTSANTKDVTLHHHISDLKEIIEKENIEEAIFLGWSLGVQVIFELYKTNPELFEAMILISGPYKNLLKNIVDINRIPELPEPFNGYLNQYILPRIKPLTDEVNNFLYKFDIESILNSAISYSQQYHKIYSLGLKTLSKIPKISRYMKRLHMINCNMNDYFFEEVFRDYAKLDMDVYLEMVKDFSRQDYENILKTISCPTLVVGSTRDIFVPIEDIKHMAEIIPNSEYLEIFRGSHYGLVEFPKMLNLGIKRFLRKNNL